MRARHILCTLLLLLSVLGAGAQKFFNLTAKEVSTGEALPYFAHTWPLPKGSMDSIYSVEVKYPEYIDVSKSEAQRISKLLKDVPKAEVVPLCVPVMERKREYLDIGFCPIVRQRGKYRKLVSFMLTVKSKPKSRSTRRKLSTNQKQKTGRWATASCLREGKWAKISVPHSGIFSLDEQLIRRAGFTDITKVHIFGYGGERQRESIDDEAVAEYDDLREVPSTLHQGKRIFLATGPVTWETKDATKRKRNPWATAGYYFITERQGEPLVTTHEDLVAQYNASFDRFHELHEVDNYAWHTAGSELFEDDPFTVGQSRSYTIEVPIETNEKGDTITSGTLSVALTAGDCDYTSASVEINGEALGNINIALSSHDNGNIATAVFPVTKFQAKNTVRLTNLKGGTMRLDYISAYHDTPTVLPCLETNDYPSASYVYNITNQNHHADKPCDMVIIVPTSQKLMKEAKRLQAFHQENDSLRVNIVPADELYNEFSSGTPSAMAYRLYMKMLYDRAVKDEDMPRYLLLFGSCVWDNRMLSKAFQGENADDYLLCYEGENSFSATESYVTDDFFTYLDDNESVEDGRFSYQSNRFRGKMDIAVGRFPVHTAEEARIMVDKTIAYAQNNAPGSWQNTAVFLGDDGDKDAHMRAAESAAEITEKEEPDLVVRRIMWDAFTRQSASTGYSYPEVTEQINHYMSSGALFMDYNGHGRPDALSHELVLSLNDTKAMRNKNYPLWIAATCDIMPFDSPTDNIGEAMLLNPDGGTMAFFGTTRTVYVDKNRYINDAYVEALVQKTNGQHPTIGEAQRIAKNKIVTLQQDLTVNKLQYSLLGDPALRLHFPELKAVVDSINSSDISLGQTASAKAGLIMRVKGHIERNGALASDFSGTLTSLVRDSQESVICKRNDPQTADGFEYPDRTKTLFQGNDSVRGGVFEFSFPVPQDINYSDESGKINIFALGKDGKETANGSTEALIIGGSEVLENDSTGPKVWCYLNNEGFQNGGDVNTTPYFFAKISDKDGINTTGNGIGHDLQLTVDNSPQLTFSLNDNFSYEFGSYQEGMTWYLLPTLSEGRHKLRFRAWDVLNNCTTKELSFNVVRGLEPKLLDISLTQNPAREGTAFIVSIDREQSPVDVDIEVFDISGRPLWRHKESGTVMGGSLRVQWDLSRSDGGRLDTGVYLYRVRLSSDGSNRVSKAKKLIVIR